MLAFLVPDFKQKKIQPVTAPVIVRFSKYLSRNNHIMVANLARFGRCGIIARFAATAINFAHFSSSYPENFRKVK
jgi:hypothetical protein